MPQTFPIVCQSSTVLFSKGNTIYIITVVSLTKIDEIGKRVLSTFVSSVDYVCNDNGDLF